MKEYFARLSSLERRFVVVVLLVLFILLNAVFVWPHFSEWDKTKVRLAQARDKVTKYNAVIAEEPKIKEAIKKFEKDDGGAVVEPENQVIEFLRNIQSEAAKCNVNIIGPGRPTTKTNDIFYIEQHQPISIQSGEQELVTFLYNLGMSRSMTRVRALSLQRETAGHQLRGNVTLVASYQKKASVRATAPAAKTTTPTAKKP